MSPAPRCLSSLIAASSPSAAFLGGQSFAGRWLPGSTAKIRARPPASVYAVNLANARHLRFSTMSAAQEATPPTPSAELAVEGVPAALESVRRRVADAAVSSGRAHTPPRLVAVSKTKPLEALMAAYDAGQRVFGENYVQELLDKAPAMPEDVKWHFIGHIQSNKAKSLVMGVPNLSVVETVDSIKLAGKLDAACKAAERSDSLGVYLQVDTSGEDTKSGVAPKDCPSLARQVADSFSALRVSGLMTIGAPGDEGAFARLASCREEVAAALGVEASALDLSMGMSGDFEAAIAAGSTNVRVGSTIFGARHYPNRSA